MAVVSIFFASCAEGALAPPDPTWTTAGNNLLLGGKPVVLHGLGLTCTEYLLRSVGMPCFCKYKYSNPAAQLVDADMDHINAILAYLRPIGGTDDHVPVVRLPVTASYWLNITTASAKGNFERIPDLGGQYRALIGNIVGNFTNNGVVTIIDLHWTDDDTENQPMAQKVRADGGPTGNALDFWDSVAAEFGANKRVFYELYNEPHTSDTDAWMSGSASVAGELEMLATVRKHAPDAMVIIAGAAHYAYDVDSLLTLDKKLLAQGEKHYMWNFHPYMSTHQAGDPTKNAAGFESRLEAVLAGSAAPVILTELGQGCCAADGACFQYNGTYKGKAMGYDEAVLQIAAAHGTSWTPFAWKPSVAKLGPNTRACLDLNGGGVGTPAQGFVLAKPINGSGADWERLFATYAGGKQTPAPASPTPAPPPPPTPVPPPTPTPPPGTCTGCGHACPNNKCMNCGVCTTDKCDSEALCLGPCNGSGNAIWCGGPVPVLPTPAPAPPTPPTPPTPPPPPPTPAPAGTCTGCGHNCHGDCSTCGVCVTDKCASEALCMGPCNGSGNAMWCGGGSTPTPAPPPSPPPTPSTGCPGGSLADCMHLCPATPPDAYKACVASCAKRCP